MTYECVPLDNHQRNLAKRAIQTWKTHFINFFSGTAKEFPMHLWDLVIPQAEWQLLLIRQTNANPKLSAYAYLYGPPNYNAKPFVPIGMDTLIHKKSSKRKTFAQHCVKSWVLGTVMEYYHCWDLWWVISTKAKRVSDMVFFKHKYVTDPSVTPSDAIIATADKMSIREPDPDVFHSRTVDII